MTEEQREKYNQRIIDEHILQEGLRLDRIESKLDRLTDTVVALARAEEKLISLSNARNEMMDTLDLHEERIDHHEKRLNDGAVTLGAIQKVFWTVLVGGVTAVIARYLGAL